MQTFFLRVGKGNLKGFKQRKKRISPEADCGDSIRNEVRKPQKKRLLDHFFLKILLLESFLVKFSRGRNRFYEAYSLYNLGPFYLKTYKIRHTKSDTKVRII